MAERPNEPRRRRDRTTESGPVRAARTDRDGARDPGAFAAWRQSIAPVYEVALPPRTSFALADTSWQMPHGFLYAGGGSAIELKRDAALIDRHPFDWIGLLRLVKGKVVANYDGRAVALRRGDMVLLDYALPIFCRSTAFACQTATMPRDRVPLRGRRGNMHGIVLRGSSPLGTLIGRQLDALVASIDHLDAAPAEAAFAAVFDYAVRFWPAPDGTFADGTLFDRAMTIIKDELCDTALTPGNIAKRLRVSRAGLYAAFAAEGGISGTIQSLRLDAALRMLVREPADPGFAKDVATRHAFKSVAHFSRAFASRFGRSPTDVMALAKHRVGGLTFGEWLASGSGDGGVDTIQAWLAGGRRQT